MSSKTTNSYLPPFAAPKLKYNRACTHYIELQNELLAFWSKNPISVVIEEAPANYPKYLHAHAITARVKEFLPYSLSSIIGDVVHNLRTALDLMACDLVRINGGNSSGVYFPFCESEIDLPSMIKKRNFDRASKAAIETLIKVRPYKNGNRVLRAIHDFDIQDKHQTIIPAIYTAETPQFSVMIGSNSNSIQPFTTPIVKEEQILVLCPDTHDLTVGSVVPCGFRVVFLGGSEYDGCDVVDILQLMTQTTRELIDTFEVAH